MRAETLGLLVKELGIEQVVATGGSGGARDTIIFTIMWPDLVRKIAVWSIVGGTYSTMALAGAYVMTELQTVRAKGIEGIIELDNGPFSWAAMIRQNPRNADRLRAIGTEEFHRVMTRWLDAFIPKPNEPIPGVPDWEFEKVSCPTLIVRGGWKDYDHPARTSFEVHALIQGSRLIEPPWPEDAWERAVAATNAGEGSLFDPWVLAAPTLLEFIDEP
jgi:pimeloyl-ACP methyl ester carboxylesterase